MRRLAEVRAFKKGTLPLRSNCPLKLSFAQACLSRQRDCLFKLSFRPTRDRGSDAANGAARELTGPRKAAAGDNYKGFPVERKRPTWFLLLLAALPTSCEKVKDCGTTTGHVGPIARTLMKDAREDLILYPETEVPVVTSGKPHAGPTRFTSPTAVQRVIFYSIMDILPS